MPIYEYRCEKGHTFEAMQSMTDEPVGECTVCGAPVQRVFHPVAVHFKGKGFYNTDYGTRRRNREQESSSKSESSSADSSPSSSADGGSSATKEKSSSKSSSSGSSKSGSKSKD